MNIPKFAKNNIGICISTFGLAILGYMGYKVIRKCCKSRHIGPWWTKVTETQEFIRFKRNWKHLAIGASREREAIKIKKAYKHLPSSNCLGKIYNVPGMFSFRMPGVALVASYLAEKKKVKGLFVCKTLEALSRKIQEISENPQDQRAALIVGASHCSLGSNFPQHKVAVCVEKKEGKLTIALLDSQPEFENKTIASEHLQGAIWNEQELVFRAILKGSGEARFLHSQVEIQKSFGCETFALKNSLAFLKDPLFFSRIICSKKKTAPCVVIKRLPPEYMVGAQSTAIINRYRKKGGEFETLQAYWNAHLIKGPGGKVQNHYITKKSFTYLKFVSLALKKFKPHEIQAIVNKTLIK